MCSNFNHSEPARLNTFAYPMACMDAEAQWLQEQAISDYKFAIGNLLTRQLLSVGAELVGHKDMQVFPYTSGYRMAFLRPPVSTLSQWLSMICNRTLLYGIVLSAGLPEDLSSLASEYWMLDAVCVRMPDASRPAYDFKVYILG